MKPNEMRPETIYRLIHRRDGYFKGSCDLEFDFSSVNEARESDLLGAHRDKKVYKVSKYKVTYELIEDDCDVLDEKWSNL